MSTITRPAIAITSGNRALIRSWEYRYTGSVGSAPASGPADELISAQDNALALLNGGDELTLRFAADSLPPKPAGAVRDFFLYTVGWDKDADFHCDLGWQVGPLPWRGMDYQLYGKQTRPSFANDGWIQKSNTRWVGLYTLTKRSQPAAR